MTSSGFISRADLARTLFSLERDKRKEAAELLGFVWKPRRRRAPAMARDSGVPSSGQPAAPGPEITSTPAAPTPFWRLEKFTAREKTAVEAAPLVKPVWKNRPGNSPEHYWLESWRSLGPRLLQALGGESPGGTYDIGRAVEILARAETLDDLPKELRARPPVKVQVVLDRSAHLMPYWLDQDAIIAALRHCLGEAAVETTTVRETADALSPIWEKDGLVSYRLPPPGSVVLVLGDLGALSPDECRERSWLRFGRRIRAGGSRAIVLTPAPGGLVPVCLRRVWSVMPWGQTHGEPELSRPERQKTARRLLVLLSHAFRIEPGLLRAVRLAFGGDAGSEAEAWEYLALKHPTAGTLDPEFAGDLQAEFEQENASVKHALLALQWKWRHLTADEIWFDEILSLPAETRKLLPHHGDADQARRFFAYAWELSKAEGAEGGKMTSWLRNKAEPRATDHAWRVPEFARAFAGFQGPLQFQLGQGCLHILPLGDAGGSGSPHLGAMPNETGALNHTVIADPRPDPALFWQDREAPSWASNWGEDEFGPYAEFTVAGVVQRLRWIPPGRFGMGSPEDEEGRFGDEGPRHQVTLAGGFWMMDTPVRQDLWQAVMGENPSHFKGGERPVETVDWTAAQQFVSRLNEQVAGLELSLPSEAQWEYACRGGSDAAIYGDELGGIAWWQGNSQSQTHPVAQKQSNDYGLHDMLGNVWEWCADHWHGSYEGAPKDGSAWTGDDAAASRVLRGGSWDDDAGYVRAACRFHDGPAGRDGFVGFRCVRVHTSGKREAAEPSDRGAAKQAERRAAARSLGAAAVVRLTPETPAASVPLPLVGRLRIASDSAELEFAQAGRPAWASAMGCDHYGLFAEFKADDVVQRLRWIPPGRFWMGSPDKEKGRSPDEGPRHEVTLANGFWMMDTPVRQSLWQAVMGDNPSHFPGPERPVEKVHWAMAQKFLSRLNSRIAGLSLALPSEAQWEYACRAGSETATYGELDRIAWYSGNSGRGTHAVGQKLANAYGLYDMLGNVWEWCADPWHGDYKGAPADGSAWQSKSAAASRVLRGGSWNYDAGDVRAACRSHDVPAHRLVIVGFRCVRVHS